MKGDIIINRSNVAKEFLPKLTPKNIAHLKQDGWRVANAAQKAEFLEIEANTSENKVIEEAGEPAKTKLKQKKAVSKVETK